MGNGLSVLVVVTNHGDIDDGPCSISQPMPRPRSASARRGRLAAPWPRCATALLAGRRVTGFSHVEDAEDALSAHMPFSLQDRMSEEGAIFVEGPPRSVHVEVDGRLITGQNPASAAATAEALLTKMNRSRVR